jgi:hypothetical protein
VPVLKFYKLMRSIGYDPIESLIETVFAVIWRKATLW